MEVYQLVTEYQFWGKVAGGVLPIAQDTTRLLLSLRSSMVMEPHTWGIIGGKLDEDDHDIVAAVNREFKEETNHGGSIQLIPAYVYRSPDGGFQYHNFIGLVATEFDPHLNWETERFEWLTYEEVLKISPKHFGLTALLKNSKQLITQYIGS